MKKFVLSLMFVFALLLSMSLVVAAPPTSCGNVSSVSLFAPANSLVTGTAADDLTFQGLWIEAETPPLLTDCQLEIYSLDDSVNFTGDVVSSTRSNLETFPVDKDSFLLFYEEGRYEWNIGCYTNVSNSCELLYATSNRSITFDFSGPVVTLDAPSNNEVFAPDESIDFNYSVADTYDNGTFTCTLYVEGSSELVHSVDNGTSDTFSLSKSAAGYYDWYISCEDSFNNARNSSMRTFVIDDDDPVITLISPADNITVTDNSTVEFNYSVTDGYDPSPLTCELYIDDELVNTQSVANNSVGQYNYTFSDDGTYDWYVTCVDQTDNTDTSTTQTITISVGALTPVIWNIPDATNESILELIGYTSRPGTVNITLASDDYPFPRTNQTSTYSPNYTVDMGTIDITTVYNQSFFRVEDDLGGNISVGNFLKFSGHNFLNFIYYRIIDVIPILDYFRISILPTANQTINVGENITVYDADRPTGWFNLSIELYPGANNVSVFGTQLGIPGSLFSQEVIYDTQAPQFELENLTGLQSSTTILFNISDEYNVSLETLVVNMTTATNASDFVIFTTPVTTYNTTTPDGNITCVNTSLSFRTCSFTHERADDTYNLTFTVSDMYGHENETVVVNHVVKSTVQAVPSIQDEGTTTNELNITVNWTASPEPFLDYYELSVGTALGVADIVAWFEVDSSETNYSITHQNLSYADWYFVNIRAVDTLGGISNYTATDGITIEDVTPPTNTNVEIIADEGSVWINDNTELTLLWNFTDNETAVTAYEYSIGTEPYPLAGWNSVVDRETTIQSSFTEVGLNLIEGETYYVSVKARNENLFGGNMWSAWYSSAGVTVDTTAPANGYLTYEAGSIDVNYIDVTFLVGNDATSGVDTATLLSRKAPLSGGSCSFSGVPDYQEELNATIIGSMVEQDYSFTNLDNGYCYRFALDVTDNAGNTKRYGTNQISTVVMDYTAPSTVTVADQGYITANTDLYFEWTASIDPESGVSHYQYALGTSPGASNVINWTNKSTAQRFVNLDSDDYASGHLQDEQIYYLSVRAWNAHNESLYSQASSNGILYFDFEVPSALTVISVGNDTTDDGWYDPSADENVTVILQGESGLACVWSFYDVDYIDASADYVDSCSEIGGNDTYYSCVVTNLTQGAYSVSVACADAAGNKQTTASNTDFTIYKDSNLPSITIMSPNESVIPGDEVSFIATVNETSPYQLEHYIYYTINGTLYDYNDYGIQTGSQVNNMVDFTGVEGEYEFYYVLTDVYNNSVNDSVSFIINSDEPLVTVNITGGYITQTQDVLVKAYFFNDLAFIIYNGSGTQYSYVDTNVALQNRSEYNITIDTSTLADGSYTLAITVDDNVDDTTIYRTLIIDTEVPDYAPTSFEYTPVSNRYEDVNITFYSVWDATSDEDYLYLVHNASGTYENISVEETTMGLVNYPGMIRYKALVEQSSLTTATTFSYYWLAYDDAGNTNASPVQQLTIENRAPVITADVNLVGFDGESFVGLINFSDADVSQNNASFFTCTDNSANFDSTILSNEYCMLNWSNPVAGNYTVQVTVTDRKNGVDLDSDVETFTIQILPAVLENTSVDSNVELFAEYFLSSELIASKTSYSSENLVLLVADTTGYVVNVTVDGAVVLTADPVDPNDASSFYARLLDVNLIEDEDEEIGASDRYIPFAAYAIEADYNTGADYDLTFDYEQHNVSYPTNLQILKYAYNTTTNEIDYTDGGALTSSVDEDEYTVSASTSDFSVFILAENQDLDGDGYSYQVDCRDDLASTNPGATEICGDSIDNNCNAQVDENCNYGGGGSGGSGGGSSGGGGGGSFIYVPSNDNATCSDGIQNGAEVGVDCGGSCEACQEAVTSSTDPSYCFNLVQDFDEEGINCGGSCSKACTVEPSAPVVKDPTCNDGIKNGDETGVDCGGICAKSCEQPKPITPPVTETPEPVQEEEKSSSSAILFIFLGLITMGGLVFFVVRSGTLDMLGFSPHAVAGKITFNGASTIADDDVASIARYVEKQQTKNHSTKTIKQHLIDHGYSEVNIDAAIDALLQTDYLETVQEYLGKYASEGFTDQELQDWLLDKGIKPHVIAVAMDRHRRKL